MLIVAMARFHPPWQNTLGRNFRKQSKFMTKLGLTTWNTSSGWENSVKCHQTAQFKQKQAKWRIEENSHARRLRCPGFTPLDRIHSARLQKPGFRWHFVQWRKKKTKKNKHLQVNEWHFQPAIAGPSPAGLSGVWAGGSCRPAGSITGPCAGRREAWCGGEPPPT